MSFDFTTAATTSTPAETYFTYLGDDYAQHRPSYPSPAIDCLLENLPAFPQVADVGAGTGIGSRLLAERGATVWAIEPNPEMILAATTHPNLTFLNGTAEQIPLDSQSVDLVTVFQAFHWFDFFKSLREFQRTLKPHGRLGLAWNFWDQRDLASKTFTQILFASTVPAQSHTPETPWLKKLSHKFHYQLFWQGFRLPYFTQLHRHTFSFIQTLDFAGLVGLARSQGFTPTTGSGFDAMCVALRAFYQDHAKQQNGVCLRYLTRVYTAQPTPWT